MVLTKNKKMVFLLLLLPVVMFLNINCGNKSEVKNEADSNPLLLDTVAVKVLITKPGEIKLMKTFTGNLEGEEQANVVSKISERVTSIKVKVGEHVRLDQLLLTLDRSGVTSQYYQAQAGYLNSGKDYNRMKALYEAGAISQQMLDGTKTSYEIAKANFEAAKSAVELTCPINGIVTAVNPNVGDLAVPGMPLITVASINSMKVIFSVGEGDLPNFAIGQNAEVYSELKPELIRKGRISQISKSADVQSRSFELRALFPNTADRWYKPGMFCRVNVELQKHTNVIIVPNISIMNSQNTASVYVINNGKAILRAVKTGITDGNVTEIISGVTQGEKVVTLGMNNLKNGSIVHITD